MAHLHYSGVPFSHSQRLFGVRSELGDVPSKKMAPERLKRLEGAGLLTLLALLAVGLDEGVLHKHS